MDVRRLEETDRVAVEGYLEARPTETMFLGSNLAQSGFRGAGRYGGAFLGAFQGTRLQGIVQLCRVGSLLLSVNVRDAVEPLARQVLSSGFAPRRFLGMANEIQDFLECYRRLAPAPPSIRMTRECLLQSLLPEHLAVPSMKGFRAATLEDVDGLIPWIVAFHQEELQEDPEKIDRADLREALELKIARGARYLLEIDGTPVSTLALTAEACGLVQVGGIFTPPELRGKGYATRLLSAFAHFHLNALGARRVVLQVGEDNTPARRAYEKVGFRSSGRFHFIFGEA